MLSRPATTSPAYLASNPGLRAPLPAVQEGVTPESSPVVPRRKPCVATNAPEAPQPTMDSTAAAWIHIHKFRSPLRLGRLMGHESSPAEVSPSTAAAVTKLPVWPATLITTSHDLIITPHQLPLGRRHNLASHRETPPQLPAMPPSSKGGAEGSPEGDDSHAANRKIGGRPRKTSLLELSEWHSQRRQPPPHPWQ